MAGSGVKAENILPVLTVIMIGGWWVPWPEFINVLLTAGVVILSIFIGRTSVRSGLLTNRPFLLGMLLFFAWLLISVALSSDKSAAFRALDPRLPLLYFPISIGLLSIDKKEKDQCWQWMAYVITIVCAACMIYSVYRAVQFHDTAYLYNDAFSQLTGQQSIYLSLLVNFSIYITASHLFLHDQPRNQSLLNAFCLVLLFASSFLLASRTLMIILYVATLVFLLYYVVARKKYLEGLSLFMALGLGLFLATRFFPSTFNRFRELAYAEYRYENNGPESHYNMEVTADQWNGANLRKALWQCGWDCFRQSPLTGVTLGDKKTRLMSVYEQRKFQFALRTERNVHNNYLDILLGTGLVGLILFLVSWLLIPAWMLRKEKDWLALLMLCTLSIAMVTENYFDRSLGGMIVGFFVPFLLTGTRISTIQRTR